MDLARYHYIMLNGDGSTWYALPELADLDVNKEHTRTAYQDEGAYIRSGGTATKK